MHPHQQDHWTQVYTQKAPSEVSWFQAEPEATLRALDRLQVPSSSSFVDVGGGASNLVDALLQRGWEDVTVIDIAGPALEVARQRLGEKAAKVHWEAADITGWQPPRRFDVWHDRAVFHFLAEPDQRAAYRRTLLNAIAPAGLVIMATFALDGPEKCSGLTVQRYDAANLSAAIGSGFTLVEDWREEHLTPWGASQWFTWCVFRRRQD